VRNLLVGGFFAASVSLTGCGGSDGSATRPSAALSGTLAYVESTCREDLDSIEIGAQRLVVQAASQPPRVVHQVPAFGSVEGDGTCVAIGLSRYGLLFLPVSTFQRLAVSPDGQNVIFEVTDAFSVPREEPLPEEAKGFFSIRADGSGLRRLGPASRERTYRFFAPDEGLLVQLYPDLAISPNGRLAAFTDRGLGPNGETNQIFVMDLRSGERHQVTRLRRTAGFEDPGPPTCCPRFQDDATLLFPTTADVNGSGERLRVVSVRVDGSEFRDISLPPGFAGAQVAPQFAITSAQRSTALLLLDGDTPEPHREVFVSQGMNLLQVSNFKRLDTSDPLLSNDGSQVYFVGSGNPRGQNPTENCQVFEVSSLGGEVRQISDFHEGDTSGNGCIFSAPDGCAASFLGQDPQTGTLVLHSNCDPLGSNPYGAQIFALDPTTRDIRQLTGLRGIEIPGEDVVEVELPGPFAYSAIRR